MNSQTPQLLADARDAARSILARCEGHTYEEYEEDRWFRRIVEREFEIIGESLNRLARLDPETSGAISQLRRIVNFRNRIIHGYDAIDDATVWGVVADYLPALLSEIDAAIQTPHSDS